MIELRLIDADPEDLETYALYAYKLPPGTPGAHGVRVKLQHREMIGALDKEDDRRVAVFTNWQDVPFELEQGKWYGDTK